MKLDLRESFHKHQLRHMKHITKFLLIIITVGAFLFLKVVENLSLDFGKKYNQSVAEFTLCQIGEVLPNGAFCLSNSDSLIRGWIGALDGHLCKNIEKLIQHSSVVDFGAGLGQYGKCFLRDFKEINLYRQVGMQQRKIFDRIMSNLSLVDHPQVIKSYEGYDGASNIETITKNFIRKIDLSTSFNLGRKFDWVLSLEVGEHIPEEAEDIFLGNLIQHSCKGIILSWALPGQPGLEHINPQNNEYIISKMEKMGFKNDVLSQRLLRERASLPYFRNTIMVFERTEKLC